MILKAITIENFKGIREPVRVELKPVTLLFGANSAGKSTVVQALHYAQEIFERHNVDPGRTLIGGEAIELGGFDAIVHGQDRRRSIRLGFELDMDGQDLPGYRLEYVTSYSDIEPAPVEPLKTAFVEVQVAWSDSRQRPILNEYSVSLNGQLIARLTASMDLRQIEVSALNVNHHVFDQANAVPTEEDIADAERVGDAFEPFDPDLADEDENELGLLASLVLNENFIEGPGLVKFGLLGQQDALPNWGRPLDIQPEAFGTDVDSPQQREFIETVSDLIVGPGELLRDALRTFRYVGPLREVPSRNYGFERSPDESRWARGLGAWDLLSRATPGLIDQLNDWLGREDRLNTGYQVNRKQYKELDLDAPIMHALSQGRMLDEDIPLGEMLSALPTHTRLYLREENNGIEVLPQDVGVGISQLIPVIVAALASRGIVAIEQPELHIHPAWQVILGDLFLSQAKERDVLFLLETHSEHLMLRLLKRIRETHEGELPPGVPGVTPDDVAVLYVESRQGGAKLTPLSITDSGDFSGTWPRGFFDERAKELF